MTDIKVRNLDEKVASALRSRARAKAISLEEEVRRPLAASVEADRAELVRRARALHAAAGGQPGEPEVDPQGARCLGMSCILGKLTEE